MWFTIGFLCVITILCIHPITITYPYFSKDFDWIDLNISKGELSLIVAGTILGIYFALIILLLSILGIIDNGLVAWWNGWKFPIHLVYKTKKQVFLEKLEN